jgi:predicted DNA-binding transcriptional regulator AlpA
MVRLLEDIAMSEELRALPPVLDVPTAGRLLGLGRSAAYDLILTGEWPTPVLRLGRRLRIPTAPLLALLGLSTDSPGADAARECGERLDASPTAPGCDPKTGDRA